MDFLVLGGWLLLIGACFQLLIGLLTPWLGFPVSLVGLSARTDEKMWGRSTRQLLEDEVVRGLRTHHTIVIGGLITGLALVQAPLAWFGVRQGALWAIAAFTAMGLAMLAWWIAMVLQFTRAGVGIGLRDVQPFVWVHMMFWLPGTVLSWIGWWMDVGTFTPPP